MASVTRAPSACHIASGFGLQASGFGLRTLGFGLWAASPDLLFKVARSVRTAAIVSVVDWRVVHR